MHTKHSRNNCARNEAVVSFHQPPCRQRSVCAHLSGAARSFPPAAPLSTFFTEPCAI